MENDGEIESVLTGGQDTVAADTGNDTVAADTGNDTVAADAGNDTVAADAGNDTVAADTGNDTVAAETDTDVVPEGDYTFELPEGMELDADMAAAAQPVLKELGLKPSQANKLANLIAEVRQKEADAIVDSYVKTQNDYVAAAKADKEIGGTNWGASTAAANQALQKFGTPALTAALKEHGMQNHPELIRALARVGSATADDTAETGGAVDTKEVPAEERWYGSTTPTTKRG
jgi:Ca2+-binding RTX toxin-like protein